MNSTAARGTDGWTVLDKETAFRKLRDIVRFAAPLARFGQKEPHRAEKSST
jgi:hypothetical protein